MANIFAILPGLTIDALSAMDLAELVRWHDKAKERSGSETK